ncbi:hypothetical protein CEXT_221841 [Caerostris extrusa]|uniref:Uncharacterized protein n=1 Tax=Caerostris extrusa TaxID=172846 RepID=A0AAV4MBF9_CAEEX|nr:hypothetical protein CEXT_221841 [Caerostris extrusa]
MNTRMKESSSEEEDPFLQGSSDSFSVSSTNKARQARYLWPHKGNIFAGFSLKLLIAEINMRRRVLLTQDAHSFVNGKLVGEVGNEAFPIRRAAEARKFTAGCGGLLVRD